MKSCFTWLAIIGLAAGTVGCGSDTTTTEPAPAVETDTELGAPGGIEAGTGTGGMDPLGGDGEATGGPELP